MTAFRGTYADWKNIKTRGVVQIVFEVPLADSDAAYEILGGMPNPAKERWFGIAALKPGKEVVPDTQRSVQRLDTQPEPNQPPARAKRPWRDLPYPQQAGICINEPAFAAYLREEHPDEWHETGEADACLKFICGINSKSELATNKKAATLWFQIDSAYQAWRAVEHA